MLRRILKIRDVERVLLSAGASERGRPLRQLRTSRRASTVNATEKKWDLLSAVCLERHPVILKPMEEIEAEFQRHLTQIEFENSMKSDHELQLEAEVKKTELLKKGIEDAQVDVESRQSAQDFEDAAKLELSNFKLAPQITEADEKNIKTSLRRKLDKNLVLLTKQKVGDNSYWIPPQSLREDGETMRQAADRTLRQFCGPNIDAKFYGNAPVGFYKYVYPRKLREQGCYGAKIFYFLAKYRGGVVSTDVEHQWLDWDELQKVLPNGVCRSVRQFLLCD